MRDIHKDKLVENIQFTSQHVEKANQLVAEYQRIHRVPFHSLSALLMSILILVLLWSTGLVHVVHTVADKLGTTLINVEYVPNTISANDSTTVSSAAFQINEDEPLIDLSFITDFFTNEPLYSSSAIFKYAIVVALFDTIIVFGLAVALTYGLFYGYHIFRVRSQKDKIYRIVRELEEVLSALNSSIIDQEYWHIPYLRRMENYFKQQRVDTLRECYDLIDLDIRHKQLVQALSINGWVDVKALTESTMHPKNKVLKQTTVVPSDRATSIPN